jgi:hypothetical protein
MFIDISYLLWQDKSMFSTPKKYPKGDTDRGQNRDKDKDNDGDRDGDRGRGRMRSDATVLKEATPERRVDPCPLRGPPLASNTT